MLRKILQSVSKFNETGAQKCFCSCPSDMTTQYSILHNGVRIATEQVSSPLTCVSLFVAAGSRYETYCNNGLTHFIEHMAYKGFKSMDKSKLEESMIYTGGKLTAHTSREMQIFSAILPSEHATTAVDKLSKIITELDLKESEMEQERYNISLELIDAENDPKQLVFDYLHATAFQGTPLGQRVMGSSENLYRFEPNSTAAFLSEHYQPYRLVLATSGNVSHDKIMSLVEKRFGDIAPQPCCEPEPGPTRFTGSSVVYRDDTMPLAHVAVAFEAPGYSSSDYLHMLLLKHVVGSWDVSQGQGEGNAPLVARGVALDKSCESYKSFYIAYRDIGLWGVYFVADRWKLDEVLWRIQDQWLQLCSTLQQSDIERAMGSLRLELARRYAGVVRSSRDIGVQVLNTSRRHSLDDMLGPLDCVKVQALRELADHWLYDRCPAVAAVGPTEAMPDYTRTRANTWWLRL